MNILKNNKALILSILTISLPAIIEMGLNTLVGLSDTILLSFFVGEEALAAAGNANQIIFTVILIFSSFNVGATAIISRSFGEKNYKRLNDTSCQNLSLNIIIGFIIMLLTYIFAKDIMGVFNVDNKVFDMGVTFLRITSLSLVFMFFSFAASASLRGIGNTMTPMLITTTVNVINIILNILLIKGIGIFPEMGIKGSAVATTISRILGAAIYLIVLLRGDSYLKIHAFALKLKKEIILPLWKLSSAAGVEQFLTQTAFFLSGVIVTEFLGTSQEAGFRVLLSIEQISIMPAIGISIAAATLVGKALGEGDPKKAHFTGYVCFGMGIFWGVFIGAFFIAFPSFVAGLFTPQPEVIAILVGALFVVGVDQPFLNYIFIVSGALRGAGDTITVMVLTSLRLWVLFLPLTFVSVKYLGMGVNSVWVAEIISVIIFSLVMHLRFARGKWTQIKL
ncbi:MAG TPA: MATE family efflux transporter [Pseudobacteroides sp.]|uniref:MATE family efflux transporter n=1 Tax=Pseudobacteroides sp. TaxID=1968840 RepID=UPI002F9440E0